MFLPVQLPQQLHLLVLRAIWSDASITRSNRTRSKQCVAKRCKRRASQSSRSFYTFSRYYL
ncbi:Uncharacterized protein BM_BM594 [Brugia malayi]|uniref:Bm594, isoform h n=1 Tax=Brugia malayi TaxID=6279 RepID=A0A1P6C681_BRUMA|nr:Uncharacterized protein BM_BM594 [Brugia malayi]CDP98865.1 Bm594, isoform h [Brugia malayi]VIO98082.1 Uncharacterized protein BM_BM594 [Brugia malayi]